VASRRGDASFCAFYDGPGRILVAFRPCPNACRAPSARRSWCYSAASASRFPRARPRINDPQISIVTARMLGSLAVRVEAPVASLGRRDTVGPALGLGAAIRGPGAACLRSGRRRNARPLTPYGSLRSDPDVRIDRTQTPARLGMRAPSAPLAVQRLIDQTQASRAPNRLAASGVICGGTCAGCSPVGRQATSTAGDALRLLAVLLQGSCLMRTAAGGQGSRLIVTGGPVRQSRAPDQTHEGACSASFCWLRSDSHCGPDSSPTGRIRRTAPRECAQGSGRKWWASTQAATRYPRIAPSTSELRKWIPAQTRASMTSVTACEKRL
jgi:hypothetical protein